MKLKTSWQKDNTITNDNGRAYSAND